MAHLRSMIPAYLIGTVFGILWTLIERSLTVPGSKNPRRLVPVVVSLIRWFSSVFILERLRS